MKGYILCEVQWNYHIKKRIQIHLKIQIHYFYTYDKVDSTIILLKHPKIDFSCGLSMLLLYKHILETISMAIFIYSLIEDLVQLFNALHSYC
jgi:hypothetical protein